MLPGKKSFDAVFTLSLVEGIPSDSEEDTGIRVDKDFDHEDHEGNVSFAQSINQSIIFTYFCHKIETIIHEISY